MRARVATFLLLLAATSIAARADQDMAFPGRVEISSDARDALRVMGGIATGQTSISSAFAGFEVTLIDQHDPTIVGTVGPNLGNVGGTRFGTAYLPAQFGNGPNGESVYINDTWHIGMNIGNQWGGVGRADTSRPNLTLSWESKFYSGGVFGQEFHLQGVTTDGLTTFRPLTFFMSHDASVMEGAVRGHNFTVYDQNSNEIAVFSGDGAYPLRVTKPAASNAVVRVAPTSAAVNDRGIQVEIPRVTGISYPFEGFSDATTQGVMRLGNLNPTAGDFRVYITSGGVSAGDPYITLEVPGATTWSFGVDNSDSDKFVFSAASVLGYNNWLSIDPSNGNINMTSLSVGSTTASAGDLRLRYGTVFAARNESNSQDVNLLSFGLAASNALRVGAASANTRLTSDLASPRGVIDGDWWVDCTNGGVAPATCSINVHAGGAIRTIASVSY